MPVGCELILTATQISIPIKDKGGAAQTLDYSYMKLLLYYLNDHKNWLTQKQKSHLKPKTPAQGDL